MGLDYKYLECFALFLLLLSRFADGHGRLVDPPSRASMWRYGFKTPIDYNDQEGYCGGFPRQWDVNGGKCGICGDAYDEPTPRPHETGGKFATGIIVRRYKRDAIIPIQIELIANHRGFFEFRMCPNNDPTKEVDESCLDTNLLRRVEGGNFVDSPVILDSFRFFPANGTKIFKMQYQLPKGLVCKRCVLQWKYITADNPGPCSDNSPESREEGCGPQEEFRACADVSITDATETAEGTIFDEINMNDQRSPVPPKNYEETEVVWPSIILIVFLTLACALTFCVLLYLLFYGRNGARECWTHFRENFGPCNCCRPISFWDRSRRIHLWQASNPDAVTGVTT